jgi:HEPN domain-containing protein
MKKNENLLFVSQKWLDFAIEDYQAIEILWDGENKLYRTLCFHAQQYVEKILKGILENEGKSPPRTHDVNALTIRCEGLGCRIPLSETEILFLSSVYIGARYPPDVGLLPKGEPTEGDAALAVKAVRKLKNALKALHELKNEK